MDIMNYVKPLLKKRFTSYGMYIENHILDYLGARYFNGDRVLWEESRQHAYKIWHQGASAEDISNYFKLPILTVKWWIEIWTRYDKAWGNLK